MYFPFMMDVGGKPVVIVGGGLVALRKCELFLRFGAEITIMAPEIIEAFASLDGIRILQIPYDEAELDAAFAVVAATDDRAVNRAVSAYCQANRIPVNVVDDPTLCSFIVPATVQRGDLTLAVSTAGKSPSLAAKIRRELENSYGPEYEERLELLGKLRTKLLASDMQISERRSLLIQAATLEPKVLKEMLQKIIKDETSGQM